MLRPGRSWRIRAASVLLLAAMVAGPACTVSVDPEAVDLPGPGTEREGAAPAESNAVDAQVVGTVVDAAGQPIEGAPITIRATDTGLNLGPFLGLFTLGLACLAGVCDSPENLVDESTTGAGGEFEGTLPNAYVAGTETDTDWVVAASQAATDGQLSGPTSAFEFEVNIAVQEAPPLPLWTRDPAVSIDGWHVSIDATGTLPEGLDASTLTLSADHGSMRLTGPSGTFDTRLLETPAGVEGPLGIHAQTSADVRVPHSEGRTIYHQRIGSAVAEVPITAIPASRGAGCSATHGDGTAAALGEGCLLTDGGFDQTLMSTLRREQLRTRSSGAGSDDDEPSTTVPPPPPATQVVLDLQTPVEVALVVLRGTELGPLVEVSADGEEWSAIPTVRDDRTAARSGLVLAQAESPQAAQFLRVSHADGVDLTEVSVWEPRPGMRANPAIIDLESGGAVPDASDAGPTGSGDDSDGVGAAGWLAFVLVVGLWASLGYLDRRDRI